MLSNTLGFLSIVIFSVVYYHDFEFLHRIKPAVFNSFAAGVGTVYIFVHMLPQISHGQHLLEEYFPNIHFTGSQYSNYVVALIGFIFFYLFDSFLTHTKRLPTDEYTSPDELAFYWTNVLFIFLYNLLIGYVVGSYTEGSISFRIVYLLAYIVHFVTIKWGIYHIFPKRYERQARYPIILGLFVGYFIALLFDIDPLILSINEALLAGAMMLNVFKHELPNEKDSKRRAFVVGILSALILFMLI